MKRGGPTHPKFARLGAALGIPPAYAVGLMETLYEYAGNYAPRGDIGRLSDEEICRGAGYPGEAKQLVEAMVKEGLLERSRRYRLVIHDWSVHANDWVHTILARKNWNFIDGRIPKLSGLKSDERPVAQGVYEKKRSRNGPRTVQHPSSGALAEPSHSHSHSRAEPGAEDRSKDQAPPERPPARSSREVSARLIRLGMNPTSAEALAQAGVNLERATAVIAECQADPTARNPMAVAVRKLAESCGTKLLNGKNKRLEGGLDNAVREIGKLRGLRSSG